MDDCANLEEILGIAKKALANLERKKAGFDFLSMPSDLDVNLEAKRKEVAELEGRLAKAQSAKKKTEQVAQFSMNRQSPMRSQVPNKYYIERDEAKRLLERFAVALEQPEEQPLLFNICGIGGVGKTTLLGRLKEAHAGKVDFLEVCFTKTASIETPLKLMRKLHQQAKGLLDTETSIDPFTQQEQQFETAVFKLSQQSVDGGTASSEEARKITSWFERFIWLGSTNLTSTSNKPKSFEVSGSGFSTLGVISEDAEGLQEWIQQRVWNHPATKDQPELQELMLEPVPKLTQAFAESLMQIAQSRGRSLVLVLDTYEKAQSYLDRWLWQYLVEDTPLYSAPVRLVVVGRRSLQADEGWRKLNQDRKLLYDVQLKKFDKKYTDDYLQQVGIQNGGTRAKIYKATQGLPYYLDWVRRQRDQGEEPDFSKGNQAIVDLLLQGIDSRQRKVLQVVACCRWFDLAMIRYLLGSNHLGLQQDADNVENYFEWLKRSDFVEFTKGHYCLDDVARDVFRQSYFQDEQNQFRKTHALLADYFKQQADAVVDPRSPLPDPYEDEEWRELIAEFLYYSLFGKGKEGLQLYIEQIFAAVYLQEPDVFIIPFGLISAEINQENQHLLPKATGKFFKESEIIFTLGWLFLDKLPRSYKIKFEGENAPPQEAVEAFTKQIEASIQSLLGYVGDLKNGLGKCVGLIYKSLRFNSSTKITDSVLQAASQAEELLTRCHPKLLHNFFSQLGHLLREIEDYENSLCCYQKALELRQDNPDTFLGQSFALANLEQYEEALESSQKVIDLAPKSAVGWRILGIVLARVERHEEALKSYKEAIKIDSTDADTWRDESNLLSDIKRYKQAFASCYQALKLDPNYWDSLNSQALILSFLKDFDKAITSIDEAINLEPQEVLLRANRGIILARAGRYSEALAECEQAIKQDPNHVIGYYAKSCYYALQGEVEQAVENLQKAIDIKPRLSRREAKYNPDFDSIRDDERFRALVYPEPKDERDSPI